MNVESQYGTLAAMSEHRKPCDYCGALTIKKNIDGPIRDTHLKAYVRGRAAGVDDAVAKAKAKGAPIGLVEDLKQA